MKTSSESKRTPMNKNRGVVSSERWLKGMVLASGILLVFGLMNQAGAAEGGPSCRLTSQAAAQSCRQGARSDFSLASGMCENLSDASARKSCNEQTLADEQDALQGCSDQRDARQAVCKQLGGGPYDPAIEPSNFVATIDNPLFPLTPGTTFIYEGQTAAGLEHNEVFVTHNTREILGVSCVEVHDTVKVDDILTEDTLDWYAQDKDGNVWYFGENSKQLADGLVVGLEGSWTAGVDRAKPGIIMKAAPAVGDFYRQEFSLGTAEDMAEVTGLNETVNVMGNPVDHCLKTEETSPLEPDALEDKFYCAGIGNVLTNDITAGEISSLITIIPPSP